MGAGCRFDASAHALDLVARGETAFVLGSAVKPAHEVVPGHCSVHTSQAAPKKGVADIQRIGLRLRREGRRAQGLRPGWVERALTLRCKRLTVSVQSSKS
jgi:hypothetical protein